MEPINKDARVGFVDAAKHISGQLCELYDTLGGLAIEIRELVALDKELVELLLREKNEGD